MGKLTHNDQVALVIPQIPPTMNCIKIKFAGGFVRNLLSIIRALYYCVNKALFYSVNILIQSSDSAQSPRKNDLV